MALLLNIDTATEHASICISLNEKIVAMAENSNQKNHAAFVQLAIQKLLLQNNYTLQQLDAISVANGPGSYTGLRVGLSAAKGLCYTLNKPLILINTLEIMAKTAKEALPSFDLLAKNQSIETVLFCPMIDARRMEVFTGLYDASGVEVFKPTAMLIDIHSFANELATNTIIFFGSGSAKWQNITNHPNCIFLALQHNISQQAVVAYNHFNLGVFEDLAYSEPFYLKPFFSTQKEKNS